MMVNFYYKKDIGIMCQTILFNDINILSTDDFLTAFHSFRFE